MTLSCKTSLMRGAAAIVDDEDSAEIEQVHRKISRKGHRIQSGSFMRVQLVLTGTSWGRMGVLNCFLLIVVIVDVDVGGRFWRSCTCVCALISTPWRITRVTSSKSLSTVLNRLLDLTFIEEFVQGSRKGALSIPGKTENGISRKPESIKSFLTKALVCTIQISTTITVDTVLSLHLTLSNTRNF